MYCIQNGKLYKDGKPLFALGESYYPSFHPCKFPVPPEGDRAGEMEKDLKGMAEAGFNHVRFAALGELSYDAERNAASIDSPFVDSMIREAEKNGLSASVRLQGFSVNLRGFADADMIDRNGKVPEYVWSDFVRSTPNHVGILEDNFIHARDLAKHYAAFPNMVGCQIYNEPKYPRAVLTVCDYNPHTIAAFRAWLTERGVLSEEEAATYEPPRGRKEQSPEFWALWRLFSTERLCNFLANAARGAKAGADMPTFTCLTADSAGNANPTKGVDIFGDAKCMDLVGYTIYKHAWGAEYYPMCLDGDAFQCAAQSEGTEAWCIELDSRTYIPPSVYNKGVYATIGSGVKGIVFYQWRGDCPVPGVPHPNSCGVLNYDGTKTENYDNAVAVNRWIAENNDLLINARRANDGVGLFYSLYSIAFCDALENDDDAFAEQRFCNTVSTTYKRLYESLRRAGYTVTIVDAEHLEKADVKTLVVADLTTISAEETAAIARFSARGGKVFVNTPPGALNKEFGLYLYDKIERSYEQKVFLPPYSPYDLPELTGIKPSAVSLDPNVGVQVLRGDGYSLLVLTDLSPVRKSADAKLRVDLPFATARFTSVAGEREVEIDGCELTVKNMTDGGVLILSDRA